MNWVMISWGNDMQPVRQYAITLGNADLFMFGLTFNQIKRHWNWNQKKAKDHSWLTQRGLFVFVFK